MTTGRKNMATEQGLVHALWNAKTATDIAAIETMAVDLYGEVGTRHVGDRENNIGTIRVGSDPALGVVERITNGIDAMLELGRMRNPGDDPRSPVDAAEAWYGIPRSGVGEMTNAERRSLGEKVVVWLDESGESKRPTVGVSDEGIGISKKMMPETLLSLNESNKVRQMYTMGNYGQGGAVTYGWSQATIIMSRRHPDFLDGESDRVTWTIVREYDTDPEMDINSTYKYLVGSDNQVFDSDPTLFPDFEHGTRIIHIGYDLQGWTGPFTTGLWQFLHAAMFEPVLPFMITGFRTKDADKKGKAYGSRIIIGNAARLNHPERARGDLDVAHADSTNLVLANGLGSVRFSYWVLRRPPGSKSTSDPAAAYVRADSAVSVTLFGQRQDTETRRWLKDKALVPFLFKNMVVQINANGLTARGKREIFSATRERATKSDLKTEIYDRLAEVLRNDDELRRLNHEEKEALLQRSTSASSEKVRKRLARFIKTKLKDRTRPGRGGTESGNEGRKKRRSGGKRSARDTSDANFGSIPTMLRFDRKHIRVNRGAGAITWVEIDAKNGYLPEHDDDLSIVWLGDNAGDHVQIPMRSRLLGGKTRWFFKADSHAVLGKYDLEATLITANGVLSDRISVEIADAPTSKGKKSGSEPDVGPMVEWVRKTEWDAHDMDARTVGYVSEDDEATIIWVNRDFVVLDKALSGRSLTMEQIDTRATRYQFPVACALWLQHDATRDGKKAPSEEYQKAELERMAEAVIVAIDPDVDAAFEESED